MHCKSHHGHPRSDHLDLSWCGNYGGLAPTSALLPDDHRHHCYPDHDYLDYPDHDYLDFPWCGNYGGLNPSSLSSFLASVGPQVLKATLYLKFFKVTKREDDEDEDAEEDEDDDDEYEDD